MYLSAYNNRDNLVKGELSTRFDPSILRYSFLGRLGDYMCAKEVPHFSTG